MDMNSEELAGKVARDTPAVAGQVEVVHVAPVAPEAKQGRLGHRHHHHHGHHHGRGQEKV